jgi:uracil-DNA glycosylase
MEYMKNLVRFRKDKIVRQIENFISRLSLVLKTNGTTNLYFGDTVESQIRRHNLKVYLTKMKRINPRFLILGEAPGYKGCRLSGIPFTSEKVLSENPFFETEQMQFINEPEKLENEMSATIVWSEISKLAVKPLIWNIFPFHPHSIDDIKTNRTPTNKELAEGKVFLEELLQIFDIQKIIALGRKPESQLSEIGIPNSYVRHPANGGKNQFVVGLNTEINF